ncbi:MAG: phospholipase D-like domain-containing protein DpdK [Nevskia sp.]|nr:phospholipase D-like domain-containing protein DpdK [Nevskia sp.]
MPTLDLWSNAANWQLRTLFRSAVGSFLMVDNPTKSKPVYLCSPWISDFVVFDNRFCEFDALVPSCTGTPRIWLSDCLRQLGKLHDVRVVSRNTEVSRQFFGRLGLSSGVETRYATDSLHEKGFLTPHFYFEGSMNVTYSGVHINAEKVAYHAGDDAVVVERIGRAYLELNRRWVQMAL